MEQRQIYCKIVQVSLRPFSSKVIEFYTQLFKDLKPMLVFPQLVTLAVKIARLSFISIAVVINVGKFDPCLQDSEPMTFTCTSRKL